MAVPVDGARDPGALDRVAQDREIARGILLLAEDGRDHLPRRVVDGPDQGEAGTAALEPVVPAPVELEEEALGRHPRAAAAVPGRPPSARAGDARGAQDPAQALPADDDPLALGEQLGEVAVVDLAVRPLPELDDPVPRRGVDPPRRWAAPVAVDEARRAVPLEGAPQAPHLSLGQGELDRPRGHAQLALENPGETSSPDAARSGTS